MTTTVVPDRDNAVALVHDDEVSDTEIFVCHFEDLDGEAYRTWGVLDEGEPVTIELENPVLSAVELVAKMRELLPAAVAIRDMIRTANFADKFTPEHFMEGK